MRVEIGRMYLDTWADEHLIKGYVRDSTTSVWSMAAHFDVETGKALYGAYDLVVLPPAEEISHWEGFIAKVEAVNGAAHVELVRDRIERMRRRIKELQEVS